MSSMAVSGFEPIPILTYHQIDQAPPKGSPFRSLFVTPERFASQMRWLKRLGYQGLSMSQLMPYLTGERVGRVVGITFDDGYLNNLSHALPILQEQGFASTVYAVSSLLGQSNSWDHDLGIQASELMDVKALKEWREGGQEVGSHSLSHAHLRALALDGAWREIANSKQQLEQLLSCEVTQFCYPYGQFDASHPALIEQAGYFAATTTARSRVLKPLSRVDGSLFLVPRVSVVRSTHWIQFLMKLCTSYEDRHWLQEELHA